MFGYKLKIKVKMLADIDKPVIRRDGDYIDLRAAKDIMVGEHPVTYIPLGVAMELPKGCYAEVVSRSSAPRKSHIWNASALGIIDHSYNGDNDEWMWPATTIGTSMTMVTKNERICQFSLRLSQKATTWQKLKWLMADGVELVFVDQLGNEDRGGLGHSGLFGFLN